MNLPTKFKPYDWQIGDLARAEGQTWEVVSFIDRKRRLRLYCEATDQERVFDAVGVLPIPHGLDPEHSTSRPTPLYPLPLEQGQPIRFLALIKGKDTPTMGKATGHSRKNLVEVSYEGGVSLVPHARLLPLEHDEAIAPTPPPLEHPSDRFTPPAADLAQTQQAVEKIEWQFHYKVGEAIEIAASPEQKGRRGVVSRIQQSPPGVWVRPSSSLWEEIKVEPRYLRKVANSAGQNMVQQLGPPSQMAIDLATDDTIAVEPPLNKTELAVVAAGGILEEVQQLIRAEASEDAIATLEQRRRELLALDIAPDGCWLESAPCHGRKCRQVFYRATTGVFGGKKRRYVGMQGSGKAAAAEKAVANRNELERVDRQIKILMESV